MKKYIFLFLSLLIISTTLCAIEYSDTTTLYTDTTTVISDYDTSYTDTLSYEVPDSAVVPEQVFTPFVLDQISLTLPVGDSYQFTTTPCDVDNLIWGVGGLPENGFRGGYFFIDRDGVLTALEAGSMHVVAYQNVFFDYQRCLVEAIPSDFNVIKERKILYPTFADSDDPYYSLTLDGNSLNITGVFFGNGCEPSMLLDYSVYKNSVFINFIINYQDTCDLFFNPQFLDLTIDNCFSDYYNVYISGDKFSVDDNASDIRKYSVSRTGHGVTFVDDIEISNPADSSSPTNTIYDLHGRSVDVPRKGLYIQGGKKYLME